MKFTESKNRFMYFYCNKLANNGSGPKQPLNNFVV